MKHSGWIAMCVGSVLAVGFGLRLLLPEFENYKDAETLNEAQLGISLFLIVLGLIAGWLALRRSGRSRRR
jgi:hypothetical protein